MRPRRPPPKERKHEYTIAKEAKKLLAMRQKYAPRVLALSQQLRDASRELMEIEVKMNREALEITGDRNYRTHHIVSFERLGTIEQQLEELGTVDIAGFEDVLNTACDVIGKAHRVLDGVQE